MTDDRSTGRDTQSTDRLNREHRLSDQEAASQPQPHAATDKPLSLPFDHSATSILIHDYWRCKVDLFREAVNYC